MATFPVAPEPLKRPVGYSARLETRATGAIELLVIHCTELPDLATARSYAERVLYSGSATGNCGHLYIDRDGHCEQWVPLQRIAHHVRGHNPHSLGIELVNRGRYPDWFDSRRQTPDEAYPPLQIDALIAQIGRLQERLPALAWIAGHEDLDTEWVESSDQPGMRVRRKIDPGPLFPWTRVLQNTNLRRLQASGSSAPAWPPPPDGAR